MNSIINKAFLRLIEHQVYCGRDESLRVHGHLTKIVGQVHQIADIVEDLPKLKKNHWVVVCDYGMNTHISPIKSIEVVLCMGWLNEELHYNSDTYKVRAGEQSGRFVGMRDQKKWLSSTAMNEKLAGYLRTLDNAKNVAVDGYGGVTFREKGYLWIYNFRLGFFLEGKTQEEVLYLVPNGKNHWHPIQPLQVAARLKQLNKYHGSFMIDLIRSLKYWCREQLLPKIPNDLLEAIVFKFCRSKVSPLTEFSVLDISGVLQAIHKQILTECIDPIASRGDLNSLSEADRNTISTRAFSSFLKADSALFFEKMGREEQAIDKWSEVFGIELKQYWRQFQKPRHRHSEQVG